MPASEHVSINLLGAEQQEFSPIGRLILWITTYGRYIMITTEMVVLAAFISRFSLDRQLTDLKDEIIQKQDIITANQDLEIEFRRTQDALAKIAPLLKQKNQPVRVLQTIHSLIPQGTYLQNLSLSKDAISSQVVSLSVQSFSQFLLNLSATKSLTSIDIGTVDKASSIGIQYTLNARVPGLAPTKK